VTITAEAVAAEAAEEPKIVEDPALVEEPAKDAEPVAETPPAAEPEAEVELADAPEAEAPRRRSLFARLFARRVKPAAVEPTEPAAVEPEPQPTAVEPEPVAARPEPIVEPALDGEIAATVPSGTLAADQVEAVLVGVLDDLGSAHHRPFSRG
jgi:hypothetical protein